MSRYLTPDELKKLCDPDTGGFVCSVRSLQVEEIDGRPQLVLYVHECEQGILVHRKLYEDLTRTLGPSPLAEEFFRRYGTQ